MPTQSSNLKINKLFLGINQWNYILINKIPILFKFRIILADVPCTI